MNKVIKTFVIILFIGIILTGVVYATTKIVQTINEQRNENKGNAKLTPTFTSSVGNTDINSIWIGSFQLAWNELIDLVGEDIEFEGEDSNLVTLLNEKSFDKTMIDENSYYIKVGVTSKKFKKEIEDEVQNKFGTTENILSNFNFDDNDDSYSLYYYINKHFEFLIPFNEMKTKSSFNGSEKKYRYFGIDSENIENLKDSVDILFYNDENDFAVKLNTKEGDEVILYLNDSYDMSFKDIYYEILDKEKEYDGEKKIDWGDILEIPYINFETMINYSELCGKSIKSSDMYLSNAVQSVKFYLDRTGGGIISEAIIRAQTFSVEGGRKKLKFNRPFVILIKEKNASIPYFSLKVNDESILVEN